MIGALAPIIEPRRTAAERPQADRRKNDSPSRPLYISSPIGAKIWDAIDVAIQVPDKLLLILSKNTIASDWVENEVSKALRCCGVSKTTQTV